MKNLEITQNYQRVLIFRIKKEKVPSFERLNKLKFTHKKFVQEQAKRAICEYKKLLKNDE